MKNARLTNWVNTLDKRATLDRYTLEKEVGEDYIDLLFYVNTDLREVVYASATISDIDSNIVFLNATLTRLMVEQCLDNKCKGAIFSDNCLFEEDQKFVRYWYLTKNGVQVSQDHSGLLMDLLS